MTNEDLDNLIDEFFKLKEELNDCKNRYDNKRIEIHNKLVNLNISNYSNAIAKVSKTEDRSYLTVTKETFFNAINNVHLSQQQKNDILNNVFKEIPVSGSIIITKL